jgi:drug/metabolite transporter (DMT)-like permease
MFPKTQNSKAISAALLAVITWSLHATVATLTVRAIPPSIVTTFGFAIALALVIFGHMYFSISIKENIKRLGAKRILLLLASGFILILHWFSMYEALAIGPEVDVYIISFMWPIFVTIFASLARRHRSTKITFFEWFCIIFAFFGATLIAFGRGDFDLNNITPVAYGFALTSAISGGLYITGMVYGIDCLEDCGVSHYTAFLNCYAILLLGGLLSGIGYSLILGVPAFTIGLNGILGIAFLGTFVFLVSEWAWTYSITKYRSPIVSSVSYLTPVISAVLLVWLAKSEFSEYTLYGSMCIILANIFIHFKGIYAVATLGSLVAAFSVGILCVVSTGAIQIPSKIALVEVIGVIFAVMSSFTLSRLSNLQNSLDHQMTLIGTALYNLIETIPHTSAREKENAIECCDKLMMAIIDLDHGFLSARREPLVREVYAHLLTIERNLGKVAPAGSIEVLRERVDTWISGRGQNIGFGEYVMNILTGIILIALVFLLRPAGPIGDIVAISFGGGISYMLLYIRDLRANMDERDFSQLMATQRFFRRIGRRYYIPTDVRPRGILPRTREGREYRYRSDSGEICEDGRIKPFSRAEYYLVTGAIASAVLTIVSLLAIKHLGGMLNIISGFS